jgi:hypothetical protein
MFLVNGYLQEKKDIRKEDYANWTEMEGPMVALVLVQNQHRIFDTVKFPVTLL